MNNLKLQVDHFVGLDLGQARDSTALAVIWRQAGDDQVEYAVRHLCRWPPGTPYHRIAADVRQLLESPALSEARVVTDQTGVGKAVVSLVRDVIGEPVRRVVITAGQAVGLGKDGATLVPKKDFVALLQVLLQTRRLRIAERLAMVDTLTRKIAMFRAEIPRTDRQDDVSWREREHDDLVLAVALAVWDAERTAVPVGEPFILGQRPAASWAWRW